MSRPGDHAGEGVEAPSLEELLEFLRTFRLPRGSSSRELMAAFDVALNDGMPPLAEHRRAVPVAEVDGWRLTVDVFVPEGGGGGGALLYCHGGAWTMGSPASHRKLTAELARAGDCTVVSVDYRRAPRHRFPAPVDDLIRVADWMTEQAGALGIRADGMAVGGDSAGANIAAGAAVARLTPSIRAAVLLYGSFDYHGTISDLARPGTDVARQQSYVDPAQLAGLAGDERLNPILAPDRFPPTILVVGTDDPVAAQSTALAQALTAAGVEHEVHVAPGAPHGFLQVSSLPGYRPALAVVGGFLRRHLSAVRS